MAHTRQLVEGDNLAALRGMDGESIDLIYMDPPFMSGRDYTATDGSGAGFTDTWAMDDDAIGWHQSIAPDLPGVHITIAAAEVTHSTAMKAYLIFMARRLVELRRVMKDTASIYLHCDPTASHYLKLLMDALFGAKNYRNEIVWKRATSRKGYGKRYGRAHDILLFYSGTSRYSWNTTHLRYDPDYIKRTYRYDDHDGLGPYRLSDLTQSGWTQGESGMTWRGISMHDRGKHWITPVGPGLGDWIVENIIPNFRNIRGTIARLDALDEHDLIYWPKGGEGMPRLKRYLAAGKGPVTTDLIEDIPPIQGSSKERTGWPTQKPLALVERIIKASSNPGDVVLDPFCGCATACVAAEKLGRQWIGIDLSRDAIDISIDRLARDVQIYEDGGLLGNLTVNRQS